jgi:transcriptional regulator with GAF, ATPase, and Fis domain
MRPVVNAESSSNKTVNLGRLSKHLLELTAEHDDPDRFLEDGLSAAQGAVSADFVAVYRGERGRWSSLSSVGKSYDAPLALLASGLDADCAATDGAWVAAPLVAKSQTGELLAIHAPSVKSDEFTSAVGELAALVGTALASVRKRYAQQRRAHRLEAILDIAKRWNQAQDTNELLQQMAEASTRLLSAERASIFLWDKTNHTLVGRPALGVKEDELRLPDDQGVVGNVVQTGQMRRVDEGDTANEVDRRVDRKLEFETRNLLCVPLCSAAGERLGAFELINKLDGDFGRDDEVALQELAVHAATALENTQQLEQLLKVRRQLTDQAAERVRLIGDSPAIEALRSTVGRIADTELAILILGENGTGKEVIAQLIHYLSHRRDNPMVAVNCAALSESLLESELFGHERGAFTDAHEARAGKFELASGGTLFLDEIGEMSLGGQAKLLRVLEEKVVVRVGGSAPIHTDARVIAATNQNLAKMVREKKFREDLFFRLNVVTLDLPPLRERTGDIMTLAEHFLRGFCVKAKRKPPAFSTAARNRLLAHSWPGNVRELRNLMERLAYLSTGEKIVTDELAFITAPQDSAVGVLSLDLSLNAATQRFQTEYIARQIEAAGGNMTVAAERLGLHRSNLYRKMRQLGMHADEAEEEI